MPPTATAALDYARYRPAILRQIEAGEIKPALATLLELRRLLPPDPGLWDDMARCSWALGDADTALGLAELVAQTLSTHPAAWGKLGAMALETGDADRARMAFETALRHGPRDAHALAALNRIMPFAKSSPRTGALRGIAKNRNADQSARVVACNALGRIEEAAGNPRAAFRHFARAKALSPGRHDMASVDARVDALCRATPAPRGTGEPDAPRLIFVCGLPRSGTTLVESILLRHPDVDSLGESPALSRAAQRGRQLAGRDDDPDWLARLEPGQIAGLRSGYLDACRARRTAPLPKALLDKTPLNVFELGLARRIFPDARFMVCRGIRWTRGCRTSPPISMPRIRSRTGWTASGT